MIIDRIRDSLGPDWLPDLYQAVRTLRTRAYSIEIPEKENAVEIMHTLLGIEVKIGKRRFACPDLATARYIRVFARAGCRDFAVPYDITKISAIADQFDTAWHKMLLYLESETAGLAPRAASRTRNSLIGAVRSEIAVIGAGGMMPEFKRSTKQRNEP